MTIPIRNVYHLLAYAWDCLEEGDETLVGQAGVTSWVDLAGRLLCGWSERQRRRGLTVGYRQQTDTIAGVRGRVLVSPTLRHALLDRGRTVCSFWVVSPDTPLNRLVKSALRTISDSPDASAETIDAVRRPLSRFASVADVPLTDRLCSEIQTHSNVRHYWLPVAVARLLAQAQIPDQRGARHRFRQFGEDAGPLAVLFESFVRNFLRREQAVFSVRRRILRWPVTDVTTAGAALLPAMRTDVSLETSTRHIVVETKFYSEPLSAYRGGDRLRAGHLYQLAAYLRSIGASAAEPPAGVLLYAQPRHCAFDVGFALEGIPVRVLTLSLDDEWNEIRERLLNLVRWAQHSATSAA